jgi:hypothetical protein
MSIERVLKTFRVVRDIIPDAICAGGALRDITFGKPVKDIDVFIPPVMDIEAFREAIPDDWGAFVAAPSAQVAAYRENFGPRVRELWRMSNTLFESEFDLPVEIIVMDRKYEVGELLADFDLGFCQIAVTPDGEVVTTETFRRDAAENTATCLLQPDDPRMPRSVERGHRLMAKYPDRRFMYPLIPSKKKRLEDIFA